jgi:hypothetical protein
LSPLKLRLEKAARKKNRLSSHEQKQFAISRLKSHLVGNFRAGIFIVVRIVFVLFWCASVECDMKDNKIMRKDFVIEYFRVCERLTVLFFTSNKEKLLQ